jgi:hypothetical protein
MQRIAVAHIGGTSCTINLVTGQFVPHASTTPASSTAAPRVESPMAMPNTFRPNAIRICLAAKLDLKKEPVLTN